MCAVFRKLDVTFRVTVTRNMSSSTIPVLLPGYAQPKHSSTSWEPTKYLQPPQPPPIDETHAKELEVAAQRQLLDGKALKKTRPRRTVDYAGGMGRWALVRMVIGLLCVRRVFIYLHIQLRKLRPNPYFVPWIRPAPPYIIDVCHENFIMSFGTSNYLLLPAITAKSLSDQCFDIALYKVRAHVYK